MKLRPLFVLLLFVVSAGVLVWIYYAATRERTSPQHSPWAEVISDLNACGHRKHVKSAQYEHFAQIADQEQRPSEARLFRAMAFSEGIHEHNCANAVVRFGGTYETPGKAVVFQGKTDDNMVRSIAYERNMLQEQHAQDITRAFTSGNRYVARLLTWAAAGDLRHILLMQDRMRDIPPQRPRNGTNKASFKRVANTAPQPADSTTIYLVCPVCGNIYDAAYSDAYCPFCLTNGQRFVRFE